MNQNIFLQIINIILLLCLLVPLSTFLVWNFQYRHLKNGFKLTRLTIQHWVSGLFFLVLYILFRRIAIWIGWDYPSWINQGLSSLLYVYLLFRTWNSLAIFKEIRDGTIKQGADAEDHLT